METKEAKNTPGASEPVITPTPTPAPAAPPAAAAVLNAPEELAVQVEGLRGQVSGLEKQLKEAQTNASYAENTANSLREQLKNLGQQPTPPTPKKKRVVSKGFGFFRSNVEEEA